MFSDILQIVFHVFNSNKFRFFSRNLSLIENNSFYCFRQELVRYFNGKDKEFIRIFLESSRQNIGMLAFKTTHNSFVVDFSELIVDNLMSEIFGEFFEIDGDFSGCGFSDMEEMGLELDEERLSCWGAFLCFHLSGLETLGSIRYFCFGFIINSLSEMRFINYQ